MDERERRLALNEAMFREVNERVEDMTKTFDSDTGDVRDRLRVRRSGLHRAPLGADERLRARARATRRTSCSAPATRTRPSSA